MYLLRAACREIERARESSQAQVRWSLETRRLHSPWASLGAIFEKALDVKASEGAGRRMPRLPESMGGCRAS